MKRRSSAAVASRRHRSTRSRARSGFRAGPLVAFLLIASFGILFAGCGNVRGPNGEEPMEDDVFTADDIARFREMADDGASSQAGTSSSAVGEPTRLDVRTATEESSVSPAAVDPELARRYDGIRGASSSGESNLYRVTNQFLNVRAEARTNAASVGRLERNDMVAVMEFVNASWAKVQLSDGKTGYVSAAYIAKPVSEDRLAAEKKAFENLYFVNFGFVNVRAEPNQGSAKLGTIPGQAFVRPEAIENGWARVPFEGKQGYVSVQFLAPFSPNFITRQDRFNIPVLSFDASLPESLTPMVLQLTAVQKAGKKFMTFRELFDIVLSQESRDVRAPDGSVLVAVTGVTPQNVRQISDALAGSRIKATLFLETRHVGVSGISEKMLLTLQANGFDIQSATHSGDDLRGLTTAQMRLELEQSRTLLEEMTNRTIFAVAYPMGGVNDRVMQEAAAGGYLFGITTTPSKGFSRAEFLRIPGIAVTSSTVPEEVVDAVK